MRENVSNYMIRLLDEIRLLEGVRSVLGGTREKRTTGLNIEAKSSVQRPEQPGALE